MSLILSESFLSAPAAEKTDFDAMVSDILEELRMDNGRYWMWSWRTLWMRFVTLLII